MVTNRVSSWTIIYQSNKTEPWPFRRARNLKFGLVWLRKPGQSCWVAIKELMVGPLVMPQIISQDARLTYLITKKTVLKSFGNGFVVVSNASSKLFLKVRMRIPKVTSLRVMLTLCLKSVTSSI